LVLTLLGRRAVRNALPPSKSGGTQAPAAAVPQGPALPGIRIDDVLRRMTGRVEFPRANEAASMPILHACDELREKARLGVLSVFGGVGWRTARPADWDRLMREPIPALYWSNHRIDVIDFLGGDNGGDYRGRTIDLTGKWDDPTNYYGIWFDKDQIDRLWPSPQASGRGGDVTIRGGDGGSSGDGGHVIIKGGDGGGKT
jgi:hypothetical protein